MTRLLWATLLTTVFLPAGHAGESLVRRIAQQAESLRELEDLYEACSTRTDRRTILETAIKTSAWLEQVGGMPSARSASLLALARWELLKFDAPPSYGFLADHDGIPRPAVMMRSPGKDQLPESLNRFRNRLLFIQLHNQATQPVLIGHPYMELSVGLGRPKYSPVHATKDWPDELKALAKWGRWPEQLEGGGKAVLLVWLEATQNRALSLMIPVRWQQDAEPRPVRVPFLKRIDPEGLARAKQEALRRETQRNRKLEDLRHAKEHTPPARPAPPDAVKKPKPQPGASLPPVLGQVDPAGSGRIIQLRLKKASTYEAGKQLRVHKDGKWAGIVRFNESSDPGPFKLVYWATIIKGRRKDLAGGTLHE
jgi:hypothetical protein